MPRRVVRKLPDAETTAPFDHLDLLFIALLVAVTLLTFWPVWHYPLIDLDDGVYVGANPMVRNGLTWSGLGWAWTTDTGSQWMPLTWLSFMLDATIYGEHYGGFHVTNVVFHIANVVLLYWALRLMTGSAARSGLAAALFGIHPMRVESVVWVTERKDVLFMFFGLLALWAYVHYVRTRSRRAYGASLLALALSLLAKPMLITFPFLLLLLDYWPLRRWMAAGVNQRPRLGQLIVEKIPFALVGFGGLLGTLIVAMEKQAFYATATRSLGLRLSNVVVSYVRYLIHMVRFDRLAVFYPYPQSWPLPTVAAALVFLIAVTWAVWRFRQSFPWLLVGWFWFAGTLLPVIGFVQAGEQAMADRFSYWPAVGILIMLVWSLPAACFASLRSRRWPAWGTLAGAGALVAVLVIFSRIETFYWRNSLSLFSRTLSVTGENCTIENLVGWALLAEGDDQGALRHQLRAISINSNYGRAYTGLGDVYRAMERYPEAIEAYRKGEKLDLRETGSSYGMARALETLGRNDEAIKEYEESLRFQPDSENAHHHLAVLLAQRGDVEQAFEHYREALRLNPSAPTTRIDYGIDLAARGQFDQAISEYRKAIELQPGNADAHLNLAAALLQKHQPEEAAKEARRSVQLQPRSSEALFNLAQAEMQLHDWDNAIAHLQASLRLAPNDNDTRRALAQAVQLRRSQAGG